MSDIAYDLSLPPPTRTFRLIADMQAWETQPEIQELVEILEVDPVTTAHLLRQVNSPIYALHQSVASLDRAATMLGFDAISNTVFVETYIPKSAQLSTRVASLAYEYLIRTCVTASLIADALANELNMERPTVVRTAAMIYQLGRMVLLSSHPETYVPLWTTSTTPAGRPVVLPPGIGREIVHFRTDYTRHGEQIAKHWGLPSILTDSIRHHTDPERSDESVRDLVLAVAVCQYEARTMFESDDDLGRDQGPERIEMASQKLASTFDVPRARLTAFLNDAKQSAHRKALSLDL